MNLKKYTSKTYLLSDFAVIFYLAILKLLLHLLTNTIYSFHRDEFLYIEMGKHIDWGYVEVPPMIGIYSKIAGSLLGGSLFAYRFLPALSGAAIVLLTGLMVKEMGGKRYAQVLAAVSIILSPLYLRTGTLFQPVGFDQLYWVLGAYLLIRILNRNETKMWILFGLVCGLGLLNKYTMLLFGFGVFIGLILSVQRKYFLSKKFWIAGGISLIIFLPNIIWQHQNDWVVFEFISALGSQQLVNFDPFGFVLTQVFFVWMAFPIVFCGFYFFFFSNLGKNFRPLGWIYLSSFLILLFLSGKHYYLGPTYPMLLAAGAVLIQQFIEKRKRNWLKPVIIGFLIFFSLGIFPYGLPLLPFPQLEKYVKYMADNYGLAEALRWEDGELHRLPQDYADMTGWENQVKHVAKVYHNLPPEEKEKCVLFCSNYGGAGAVNYYREKYVLPRAITLAGSFYTWGSGDLTGEIVITLGLDEDDLGNWQNIELEATITHEYARENEMSVWICRNPKKTLHELWPDWKRYRF